MENTASPPESHQLPEETKEPTIMIGGLAYTKSQLEALLRHHLHLVGIYKQAARSSGLEL